MKYLSMEKGGRFYRERMVACKKICKDAIDLLRTWPFFIQCPDLILANFLKTSMQEKS
jgi:hypothetical protein